MGKSPVASLVPIWWDAEGMGVRLGVVIVYFCDPGSIEQEPVVFLLRLC